MNKVTVRPRYEEWMVLPHQAVEILPTRKTFVNTNAIAQWVTENRPIEVRDLLEEEWIANRLMVGAKNLNTTIMVDPQIREGVPVLAGTRISIAQIFAEIAESDIVITIADEYEIDSAQVTKLLEGISIYFDRSFLK